MLEQKKNIAFGMVLGALLVGGTTVQASGQATQDTSKAATPAPTQDTSAYNAPARSDTGAAAATTDTVRVGTDSTGMSKMGNDTTAADTSTKAGKKAWKKKHHADSTSAK
jgi:hypothetical protein